MPSAGALEHQVLKREEATRARRHKVLQAALQLYEEGGEEAITIERLATLSATSVGSLYHHYGSKDQILSELYLHTLENFRQSLRQQLETAVTSRDFVTGLVRHYLAWIEANPAASRLLLRERRSQPLQAKDPELRQSTLGFVQELGVRLKQAVHAGEVRPLPLALYQPVLLGPSIEFCRHWLSGRSAKLTPSQVADGLAAAAWRSVASP